MTEQEARDYLTHYIRSCMYGTSPTYCYDKEYKFGIVVRTLCGEERPQDKTNSAK